MLPMPPDDDGVAESEWVVTSSVVALVSVADDIVQYVFKYPSSFHNFKSHIFNADWFYAARCGRRKVFQRREVFQL